jgi:ribosomal protein S18 acetylase RimI-like enzyme
MVAMNTGEVLALYDAQMRAEPAASAGVRAERVGSVVRCVGVWNVVLFWDRQVADPRAMVAEQAEFARANGLQLEWKLYGHDGPPELASIVQREGFAADESETFMAFDLAGEVADASPREGFEIRAAVDERGVEDFVAVSTAAFGWDRAGRVEAYVRSLGDRTLALYVAYLDGCPVSSGRLQLPEGRAFASMWGGGTSPDRRGLGFYRALVAFRAREARRRGYRYVTVDARESSRPILERLGFVPLSGITGWVLRP